MSVPQETLDRLPPEQRAKAEETMKARASVGQKTRITKGCFTNDEFYKALLLGAPEEQCRRTIVTSSKKRQEVNLSCTMLDGGKMQGTIKIDAVNPEAMTGTDKMTVTSGETSIILTSTFKAKWLGAACPE